MGLFAALVRALRWVTQAPPGGDVADTIDEAEHVDRDDDLS